MKPHQPGEEFIFSLAGVNDFREKVEGKVTLDFYDESGNKIAGPVLNVALLPDIRTNIPVSLTLPDTPGGYLLTATFTPDDPGYGKTVVSRRFIKIGNIMEYRFYEGKD
jgi:hypothetical protein